MTLAPPEQPDLDRAPSSITRFCAAFGLLLGEGASIGLAAWSFRSWKQLEPYVSTNTLSLDARKWVAIDMLVGGGIAILIGLILVAWRRLAGLDLAYRLARRSAPLLLAGMLPLFCNWKFWNGHDLNYLVTLGTISIALGALTGYALDGAPVAAGGWSRISQRFPRFPGVRFRGWCASFAALLRRIGAWPRWPLLVVCVGAASYAAFFSFHTIQTHYKLGTAAFDLGIEHNLVWNAAHLGPLFKTSPLGGPTSTHLGYHQTYFAYVIALFYLVAPRPETLLVVQAVLVGAAALPLFFFARRRVGPWPAALVATLFVLYPPVHGANLYDFHYITLAPFFLWLTLALLDVRRDWLAALAVVLTLSVREDMSALLAIMGAFMIFSGIRPKAGALLVAIGSVYFVVLKFIIMPRFLGGVDAYIHQYADMLGKGETGFRGVLKTAFGNPAFTISKLLETDKLIYVLQILVPLAFLPWRRPIGLLCTVPGFFFTLLSTRYWPLVQISFQYTAYWTSFLFLAVVSNLQYVSRVLGTTARKAWVVTLLFAGTAASYQYGAMLQQNTVHGGFGRYVFGVTAADRKNHDDLYALIAQVPPKAKIVSSELVVAHVASRPDSYTLRTGTFDAEYVIAMSPIRADEGAQFAPLLRTGKFGVVERRGKFVLAKRDHGTDGNDALLKAWGI
jgi:uncharacterized membrane protein